MNDYDYLSLIVEISPQTQREPADIQNYESVSRLYDRGFFRDMLNFMCLWDYGEDVSETQSELDKFDEVLVETDNHILTICKSKNFGWTGNAFFLYRKDKQV